MKPENQNAFNRICAKLEFVAHRDFYAFAIMLLVLFGLTKFTVGLTFVTTTFVFAQWALTAAHEAGRRTTETGAQGV